MAIE
jgi:hypothetical protein